MRRAGNKNHEYKERLLIPASAVVLLNGCATSSMKNSYDGFDVSKIDPFIKVNQTTYAQAVAAEKNVPVEDVDVGEEFEWCNIACHTARGAVEAYGKLANIEQSVKAEPNDGSRFTMIFPAK